MTARRIAGALLVASSVTHLSEWAIFPWSLPLAVATAYGAAFLVIGVNLLRDGDRVLLWGAVLPLSAAFLGTGNAIVQGAMHPITRWHLFVDLVAGPICLWLWRRSRAGVR